MRTLLFLPVIVLASCSQFDYYADGTAKIESAHFKTFGGSSALDTAGGTRLTQNHNKTAGQLFQAVTAVAGGISASVARKSDNALSATKDTNAVKESIHATSTAADLEKFKIGTAADLEKFKASLEVAPKPTP